MLVIKLKQYYSLRKKKDEETISKFTTDFDVNEFLRKFPNPLEHFSNPNRIRALNPQDVNFLEDKNYASNFLYSFFTTLRKKDIDKVFQSFNYDLIQTCDRLEYFPRAFQIPKKRLEKLDTKNLTLIQEVCTIFHNLTY